MVFLLCVGSITLPGAAAEAAPEKQGTVIITEVQMTGASASEEFIELYNTTDTDIVFSDKTTTGNYVWKLQFFNSTTVSKGLPDWSKPTSTIMLNGTLPAHGYFILSSRNYDPGEYIADQYYTDRLANTGGALQLTSVIGSEPVEVQDRLAWSSSKTQLPGVWPSPSYGGSLQRVPDEDDAYALKDGHDAAFINDVVISPYGSWTAPLEVDETDSVAAPDDSTPVSEVTEPAPWPVNSGLADPYITELLPNPATPSRDESDEFIELYNPNEQAFSLKGYTLQVGNSRRYDFKVTSDFMLPPRQYVALYSDDTKLVLSNAGSQARLMDPGGRVISQTDAYTEAKDDVAWALSGGVWQWTHVATPGQANEMIAAAPGVKATTATAASKKAAAKAATAKVKGKTTAKTKAKAKTKTARAKKEAKPKVASIATVVQEPQKSTIHTGILVGVTSLAVLYGAYEYRYDIANRIHQLRRHRTIRR